MSISPESLTTQEKIERLQLILVRRATGTAESWRSLDVEYRTLRGLLIAEAASLETLPAFLRTCASLSDFWYWIKTKFATYRERREFIRGEMDHLAKAVAGTAGPPSKSSVDETLIRADRRYVQAEWEAAVKRIPTDPEGAVTRAKTLVEATCKFILREARVHFSPKDDLPTLYNRVARTLLLSPQGAVEEEFRKLCGALVVSVQAISEIRNRLGDSHGKEIGAPLPTSRHAELLVNQAGTLSMFLVKTWEEERVFRPGRKGWGLVVAALSMGPDEILEVQRVDETYAEMCDRVETELKSLFDSMGIPESQRQFETERGGETVSARVVFAWDFGKAPLPRIEGSVGEWNLMDLSEARDVYDDRTAGELARELIPEASED